MIGLIKILSHEKSISNIVRFICIGARIDSTKPRALARIRKNDLAD